MIPEISPDREMFISGSIASHRCAIPCPGVHQIGALGIVCAHRKQLARALVQAERPGRRRGRFNDRPHIRIGLDHQIIRLLRRSLVEIPDSERHAIGAGLRREARHLAIIGTGQPIWQPLRRPALQRILAGGFQRAEIRRHFHPLRQGFRNDNGRKRNVYAHLDPRRIISTGLGPPQWAVHRRLVDRIEFVVVGHAGLQAVLILERTGIPRRFDHDAGPDGLPNIIG